MLSASKHRNPNAHQRTNIKCNCAIAPPLTDRRTKYWGVLKGRQPALRLLKSTPYNKTHNKRRCTEPRALITPRTNEQQQKVQQSETRMEIGNKKKRNSGGIFPIRVKGKRKRILQTEMRGNKNQWKEKWSKYGFSLQRICTMIHKGLLPSVWVSGDKFWLPWVVVYTYAQNRLSANCFDCKS